MMDFPVELTLRSSETGLWLSANPIKEIERLRSKTVVNQSVPVTVGIHPLAGVQSELLDVAAEFQVGRAAEVGLVVHGVPVTYHARQQELVCLDKKAPLSTTDGK